MNDIDPMVQWMMGGFLIVMTGIIGLIIYCGIKSGPNPRFRLPWYIVDDLRKRGHLPKGYK